MDEMFFCFLSLGSMTASSSHRPKAKEAPAPPSRPTRRSGPGAKILSLLRDNPLGTLTALAALAASLGGVVSGLGFLSLRAREDLLGLSPRLTYPKHEWLVTGFDTLGSLVRRGLSVLVSDHPVLLRSAWALLLILLGLVVAARWRRQPALLLVALATSTLLLFVGSGFYRIALRTSSLPEENPSRGFHCGGKGLSPNMADRAAFETCSWLVNDSHQNDGRRSDLAGLLGWLLAVCLIATVAGSRAPVDSRRLPRLRWTLVGAHALLGFLLLYDLPRAYAFASWGLRYPRVLIDEECHQDLYRATSARTCWAFDVSAGAENKSVFFQGPGCQDFDGLFRQFKRSECLLTLDSSPPGVIAHGP